MKNSIFPSPRTTPTSNPLSPRKIKAQHKKSLSSKQLNAHPNEQKSSAQQSIIIVPKSGGQLSLLSLNHELPVLPLVWPEPVLVDVVDAVLDGGEAEGHGHVAPRTLQR